MSAEPLAAPMVRAADFAEQVRVLEHRLNEEEAGEDLGFDVRVKPDRLLGTSPRRPAAFVEVERLGTNLEAQTFAELRLLAEERYGTVYIRVHTRGHARPNIEILARFAGGGE